MPIQKLAGWTHVVLVEHCRRPGSIYKRYTLEKRGIVSASSPKDYCIWLLSLGFLQ